MSSPALIEPTTDLDTTILTTLDFDIPCGVDAHAPADVIVTCRGCAETGFLCAQHLEPVRQNLANVARFRGHVECKVCHRRGSSLDDVCKIEPIRGSGCHA